VVDIIGGAITVNGLEVTFHNGVGLVLFILLLICAFIGALFVAWIIIHDVGNELYD
jgi:hypothetical protein